MNKNNNDDETAYLLSSPANAARLQESISQAKKIKIERSSGNVFKDLNLPNADELLEEAKSRPKAIIRVDYPKEELEQEIKFFDKEYEKDGLENL